MLCQKPIPLSVDEHGRVVSNTYCMKQLGHPGKCKEDEVKEKPDAAGKPQS